MVNVLMKKVEIGEVERFCEIGDEFELCLIILFRGICVIVLKLEVFRFFIVVVLCKFLFVVDYRVRLRLFIFCKDEVWV